MFLLRSLFFAASTMTFVSGTYAANYYVDNALAVSGDGKSWSTAWNSFAGIRWSALAGGDSIFISGGSIGKTYREALVVRASGAPNLPLLITRGGDPGHDGTVVINGENRRSDGVLVANANNVIIRGLNLTDHTNAGITVTGATEGVIVENNDVQTGSGRGLNLRNNIGGWPAVIARGNRVETPAFTNGQTDGLWSSNNDGVVIDGNRITISNSSTYGHSDGIQSYLDYNLMIVNNVVHQKNDAAYNNHGLWLSNTREGGRIEVYNNIVYVPRLTKDSAVTHYAEKTWEQKGSVYFFNNIFVGGRRALNIYNSPLAEVRNNILQPAAGGFGVVISDAAVAPDQVDGNLIWAPTAMIANVLNASLSWSAWQARGYDRGGVNLDPQFSDAATLNFRPKPESPAVDRGLFLSAVGRDIDGQTRPQGTGYDIGAFDQ